MKCDICGQESDFDAAFIKEHSSFPYSERTVCASCSVKRRNRSGDLVLTAFLIAGVLGAALKWLAPGSGIDNLLLGGFFIALFAVISILPHELGHAVVARAVGWQVHRITIGFGQTLWKWRWFGVLFDLRLVPLAGASWVMPKDMRWFRLKRFCIVLAGPAVNAGLAIATVLIWSGGVGHFDLDGLPAVPLIFFWVNVWVAAINLWPYQPKSGYGMPTDGKQLLQTLSFRKKTMDEVRVFQFSLEATLCMERGDPAGMRAACDRGLALYPENPHLLNLSAINYLDEQQFELARGMFLKLLEQKDQPANVRLLFLNNLAYADVLSENPAWLAEADAYSRDACAALPWMPPIIATRGTVLVALGKREEGIKLLKKSLEEEHSPRSRAENSCHMAIALARNGQVDEARKYLELARQLSPGCRILGRAQLAIDRAPE